jgi:putative transposase
VRIAFSRLGKCTDNAFVESFNVPGRVAGRSLVHDSDDTQQIVETWLKEYSESRPHRVLGERTPEEFANEIAASRDFIEQQTRKLTLELVQKSRSV